MKQSVSYEVWRKMMRASLTDLNEEVVVDEVRVAVGELESVGGCRPVDLREEILKKEFADTDSKLDISCDWNLLEVRTRPFPRG